MIEINVQNLNKKRRVLLKQVEFLAVFVIKEFSSITKIKANIVFLSDSKIKRLNKDFKNRNVPTDVLCFCMFEGQKIKGISDQSIADIYISSDTAFSRAKQYNNTYTQELYFYVVHGLLHMLGMKDNTISQRQKMHEKQSELLEKFFAMQGKNGRKKNKVTKK